MVQPHVRETALHARAETACVLSGLRSRRAQDRTVSEHLWRKRELSKLSLLDRPTLALLELPCAHFQVFRSAQIFCQQVIPATDFLKEGRKVERDNSCRIYTPSCLLLMCY